MCAVIYLPDRVDLHYFLFELDVVQFPFRLTASSVSTARVGGACDASFPTRLVSSGKRPLNFLSLSSNGLERIVAICRLYLREEYAAKIVYKASGKMDERKKRNTNLLDEFN